MNLFYEAAMLNKQHDPWLQRREHGKIYADVLIASCQHSDWWYAPFIGISCLAELRFRNYGYGEFLDEAIFVRLTNTKVHRGRDISAKDLIIL